MSITNALKNNDYVAPFLSISKQSYGGPDFDEGIVLSPLDEDLNIDENQEIYLSGSRMCHMPFEFEGEQRIRKDYYAGSDDPIIQILGDSQKDLVLKGFFVDRYYYPDQKTISTSSNSNISVGYVNILEALRKSGKIILITLTDRFENSQNRFSYIRYAILTKTNFKVNRLSEIYYELTFSLFTENKPFYNFFAPIPTTQNTLNNAYLLGNIAANLERVPSDFVDVDSSIFDSVKKLINDVNSAISTVTKALESLSKLAQDIQNFVNRMLGMLDKLLASIAKFKNSITALNSTIRGLSDHARRIKSQALIAVTTSVINKPIDFQKNNQQLDTRRFFDSAENQNVAKNQVLPNLSIESIIQQLRQQFIDQVKKIQVRTHLVMAGETMPAIAYKEYGDANKWPRLLVYNRLKSTVVVEGQILTIPKL